MKETILKMFFILQEIKLFNPKLKKHRLFFKNQLGFFTTITSDVFISPLILTIVFVCFHC